ncbi:MAG: hypothetical protein IT384_18080 [Deltaproteobacteria bacterium]|nr:hypothetical protein [Deltaproteobacteria bacterium]
MLKRTVLSLVVLAPVACGGTDPSGPNPNPITDPGSGRFVVTGKAALRACAECPEWTPDPGMTYRTPDAMRTGVLKVEILRSASDAQPHALVDYAAPLDVDLIAGATFADVDVATIPLATYSHMRVTLANSAYSVPARAHASATVALDGALEVDYAISDYADATLGPRRQGDFFAAWESPLAPAVTRSGNHPITYPPAYPGAAVDTSGGAYRVTFELPGGPVQVAASQVTMVDARVTYYVEDAFGWVDVDVPGNSPGVLDLSTDPAANEDPASLAVRGFSIAVQ